MVFTPQLLNPGTESESLRVLTKKTGRGSKKERPKEEE
jgi:hypothetical protein